MIDVNVFCLFLGIYMLGDVIFKWCSKREIEILIKRLDVLSARIDLINKGSR